jgi:hypothetical protein
VIADHEDLGRPADRACDVLGLGEAEAHGLLDEDVLFRLEGADGRFPVRSRGGDEHRLDVLAGQELPVVGGADGDGVPPSHRVERPSVHVREPGDLEEVGTLGERRQVHHLRDPTRAHHGDAEGGAHSPVFSRR